MPDRAREQLKQACRLTGARWAALAGSDAGKTRVEVSHGLKRVNAEMLERFLVTPDFQAWRKKSGRSRGVVPLSVAREFKLGARRVWGHPAPGGMLLLIGADKLDAVGRGVWELLASSLGDKVGSEAGQAMGVFETDSAYDPNRALENILTSLVGSSGPDGAWLAIRRGESLVITGTRHPGPSRGTVLDLQSNKLLQRMRKSRSPVAVRKAEAEWAELPHAVGPKVRFWTVYPLVVGDRFIGAAALWGARSMSPARVKALRTLTRQAAQQVDLVVSLSELTSQLHRLATLNEFALAISSAEQLPQLAHRVLDHLAAIFPERRAALYIPDLDGELLQEYKRDASGFQHTVAAVRGHVLEHLFLPAAIGEHPVGAVTGGEVQSERSPLTLPLRYRESVVGALTLEGVGAAALSRYDRSMLTVVASYMAGVVEHGRLRAEAVDRAQRLEQTVSQLRQAEVVAGTRLEAQRAAETRLLQAAKLAAVGEMAAGVAHELNNPLTTVTGFAELILDEAPTEAPYRADLEMVLREARRARSVVRRLLDFARQGEHLRARENINEIVEDVLALMRHFIHTSGVQLHVHLDPELPWILLEANQMKQVLLNLLHNALHAMPGGGRLEIRTAKQERDGREGIAVQILDTGTGMEAEELERIFDPFYTTRADEGGTGLGLSVTYGIVSDHGGTIEVESQRGRGSTFSVWLPL